MGLFEGEVEQGGEATGYEMMGNCHSRQDSNGRRHESPR